MCSYKCCSPQTDEFNQITVLAELLKLVSEENRLKLLCLLRQGEHCVCEIIEHFEMSQSLVSHHLADLKKAGLLEDRKNGRQIFYKLTEYGLKITNIIFSIKRE